MKTPSRADRLPDASPSPAEIVAHREAMLRFARSRIRDGHLAEDAVQEALAAALKGIASFQGQSALRTWLFGILSHKIHDTFRREGRYVGISDTESSGAEECLDRIAGDDPRRSDDPEAIAARVQLRAALEDEIDALPEGLRAVFQLQVLDGVETGEVCEQLSITESNCWVRLHRARRRLSERLGHYLH